VEVGDQGIDSAEGERGINEQAGFRPDARGRGGGDPTEKILDCPDGGCPHRDAASGWLRQIVLGGGGNLVSLTMDDMLFDALGGDRAERAESHVEGEVGETHTVRW